MASKLAFLIALGALSACGPSEREMEIARNRSLADIERACVRKAEARLHSHELCDFPGASVDCRSQFLAQEISYCECANGRLAAEFTDAELITIARIETVEAEMAPVDPSTAASDSHFQELSTEHRRVLRGVRDETARQRLFMASAGAGRACRIENPVGMSEED